MEIKSIQCDICEKLFPEDSKEFYTIQGNVYIGTQGGLIGNNIIFDENVSLIDDVKIQHFCKDCLKEFLFPSKNKREL
jgi:hypothetical protein